MAKSNEWTGAEVRQLRESMNLTRKQFSQYLNISAVTVEKWELSPKKKLRSKYYPTLSGLSGAGVAGASIGLLAAPALIGPAAIAGGIGLVLDIISDKGLKEAIEKLESLQKLNENERSTLVQLWLKMKKKPSADRKSA
jgi:transcriptional regulator with XRE-family HTH domain